MSIKSMWQNNGYLCLGEHYLCLTCLEMCFRVLPSVAVVGDIFVFHMYCNRCMYINFMYAMFYIHFIYANCFFILPPGGILVGFFFSLFFLVCLL